MFSFIPSFGLADLFLGLVIAILLWVGWATLKYGWGWVLTKYHAATAKLEAETQSIFQGKVLTAAQPLADRVTAIEARLGIKPPTA